MAENPASLNLSPRIRERQGRTRKRILDQSAHLFIDRGFENVSVEDILEASGIARSSFYRFFSNREQVLANIVRPVFEQGFVELDKIDTDDPREIMDGILGTYATLWKSSPDALRVSTRMGGIYFYLFEDVHLAFRKKVAELVIAIAPSGIFLNDSAEQSGSLLARTVVPVLEVYGNQPDFEQRFRETMTGMLLKPAG